MTLPQENYPIKTALYFSSNSARTNQFIFGKPIVLRTEKCLSLETKQSAAPAIAQSTYLLLSGS